MSAPRVSPRRVFLSHTDELARLPQGRSFVAVAESAVIRAGHVPVDMGHFTAAQAPPATVCQQAVRACDVFVLIAGFRYGSPVTDDPGRSYTELEHDTAEEAEQTRRIFVLGERTIGPAEMFCDGTHCNRQKAFRERLRTSGVTVATVHSTDELGLALFQALMTLPADGPPRHRLSSIPAGRISFIGREGVLDRIAAGLDGGGRVAVTGMSGVGKTSTVIEYAHRHSAEFDIAWWIRAADPEMVPVGLAELARTLDLATRREPDQVAASRLRGFLDSHDRWLLVFDDVQDARGLARYLPSRPGHVLITSRGSAWHDIASTTVEVPLLERPESIAMLRTWSPEIGHSDADQVAEAVGDLPQVIDQAGSLLTMGGLTARDYLRLLDERAVEVHGHDPGGSSPTVAATWTLAFDRLASDDPAAMDLLTLIAWCGPAPVPRAVLARRPGPPPVLPAPLSAVLTDPLALADKIGVLQRRGMIVATNPVLMHRVPASLLKARSGTPRTGSSSWSALVVQLFRTTLPADVWDNPGRWDIWRQLLPHVRAATDVGRETDTVREDVAWLLDRMATYLQTTGDPRRALPLFRRAAAAGRAQFGDDHRATLFYTNNLANNLRELGLRDEAFTLNQDTFARRKRAFGDDDPDTLKSAKNLALNLFDAGDVTGARALDGDTLARRLRVLEPDHEDTLNSARSLANDLRELGRHDQARTLHEDTLQRLRRTLGDDHPRTLQCACDLADDLSAAGEHLRARDLHEDTRTRRRRVLGDDHHHTLTSAHHLATTLIAIGDDARARDLLDGTLEGRRRVLGDHHPDTVATARLRDTVVEATTGSPGATAGQPS